MRYSNPLKDLKPRDFSTKWPEVAVKVPRRLAQGQTKAQVEMLRASVEELRRLARDLEHHVGVATSELAFAERLNVNRGRLRAFRLGTAWPSGLLVASLMLEVPQYFTYPPGEPQQGPTNARRRPRA